MSYRRSHSLTWFVVLLFSVKQSCSAAVALLHHAVWQILCLYNVGAVVVFPQVSLLWLVMQPAVPQGPAVGLSLSPACVAFLLCFTSLSYLIQLSLLKFLFQFLLFAAFLSMLFSLIIVPCVLYFFILRPLAKERFFHLNLCLKSQHKAQS